MSCGGEWGVRKDTISVQCGKSYGWGQGGRCQEQRKEAISTWRRLRGGGGLGGIEGAGHIIQAEVGSQFMPQEPQVKRPRVRRARGRRARMNWGFPVHQHERCTCELGMLGLGLGNGDEAAEGSRSQTTQGLRFHPKGS